MRTMITVGVRGRLDAVGQCHHACPNRVSPHHCAFPQCIARVFAPYLAVSVVTPCFVCRLAHALCPRALTVWRLHLIMFRNLIHFTSNASHLVISKELYVA